MSQRHPGARRTTHEASQEPDDVFIAKILHAGKWAEANQQALLVGHALPMPVVVRTREYGADFYTEMAGFSGGLPPEAQRQRDREDLFGKS